MTTCQRAGCSATLDASQEAKGARFHSTACRVAAHRDRKEAERLAFLDSLAAVLAHLTDAVLVGDTDEALVVLAQSRSTVDEGRAAMRGAVL